MVLTQTRHCAQRRDPNKFPVAQLTLLALVRVAEPIALTSILPYAYPLVLWCQVSDKSHASFYAGLLVAAYALSEAATGMFWGGLSDRIGRKPVLILGCIGTIASLLIVGFSTSFWMALFGRFLGGALNGNIGVIQTMVGELVENPKHEPKAYAVMPFVWSVGTIAGPAVGGIFSTPVKSFPGTILDNTLFATFPFLLPNLICCFLMVISIIAGVACLRETHPDKQPWRRDAEDDEDQTRHVRADSSMLSTQPTDLMPSVNLTNQGYGTFNAIDEDAIEEEWNLYADGTSRTPSIRSQISQKVFTKPVIMLTIALGIFTYHSMTYDHLLPIFCQDDRVTDTRALMSTLSDSSGSLAGGLGLSVKDVGVIMSFNGIIALIVQVVVFPVMAGWLGVWKVFVVVTILHPIAYFIVPWLALLPLHLLYPGIYISLAIRNCLSILAYPVLLILIKEASPGPSCLGKINGLAASTGAACRTMASPVAGLLYSVGIQINFVAIAWWASALVALIGALQVCFIRRNESGETHHVRPAASCRFMGGGHGASPGRAKPRAGSVVRIRVQGNDSGYVSEIEERAPLISRPK